MHTVQPYTLCANHSLAHLGDERWGLGSLSFLTLSLTCLSAPLPSTAATAVVIAAAIATAHTIIVLEIGGEKGTGGKYMACIQV